MSAIIEKNYHDKMLQIVEHLLNVDENILPTLLKHDPLDKIIRAISTRDENGRSFYNNSRMLEYYPRSIEAHKKIKEISKGIKDLKRYKKNLDKNDPNYLSSVKKANKEIKELISNVYLEHNIPVSLIKIVIGNINKSNTIIDKVDSMMVEFRKALDVTLILKTEGILLNKKYKNSMPNDGKTRFQACELDIRSQVVCDEE